MKLWVTVKWWATVVHLNLPVGLIGDVVLEASVVPGFYKLRQGRVKRFAVFVHGVSSGRAHVRAERGQVV